MAMTQGGADLSRITILPGQRSGQPCIRGLRVTVWDVLDMLASGMSEDEILNDYPYMERAAPKLVGRLSELFPHSAHVFETGLAHHTPDEIIWNYAKQSEFVLVTADRDFLDL